MQVEAVAIGAFLQVAETRAQLLLPVKILSNRGEGSGGDKILDLKAWFC